VRSLPLLSLDDSWLGGAKFCLNVSNIHSPVGDLLLGFSWSWLAGSLYWGWLRWEPLLFAGRAIGLPFALVCLKQNWGKVGNFFLLRFSSGCGADGCVFLFSGSNSSLLAAVDASGASISIILQRDALEQMHKRFLGTSWAVILAFVLLTLGIFPLRYQQRHWWAFIEQC